MFTSLYLMLKKIKRKIFKVFKRKKPPITRVSTIYNKIYLPEYILNAEICGDEPVLFNSSGHRIHSYFLRDMHSCHLSAQQGHYILWDRYNFGLKTHFYSHRSMLETFGKPDYRYAMLVETKGIAPDDYNLFDKYKGLNHDFDNIFTYDEKILNDHENARFVPFCASVKLDFSNVADINLTEKLIDDDLYKKKRKNISMLSSNKKMCDLHKARIDIAEKLKKSGIVDTYGTFDGGAYVKAIDTLYEYRYSIVFENVLSAYTFTEKLTNCFAMQCIPIYLGASSIDDFFNSDGIIKISINNIDNIQQVLEQCSEKDYYQRKAAILDNYNRVKEYFNVEDNMYLKYLAKNSE